MCSLIGCPTRHSSRVPSCSFITLTTHKQNEMFREKNPTDVLSLAFGGIRSGNGTVLAEIETIYTMRSNINQHIV